MPCGTSSTSSSPGQELPLELGVLADVGGHHLADLPVREKQAEPPVVDAAVVRDRGQVPDAAADERGDQVLGDAAEAEAADDERRAVGHVRDRRVRGRNDLVDHRGPIINDVLRPPPAEDLRSDGEELDGIQVRMTLPDTRRAP